MGVDGVDSGVVEYETVVFGDRAGFGEEGVCEAWGLEKKRQVVEICQ